MSDYIIYIRKLRLPLVHKSVKDQYANNHWGTLTKHAQLDDNGDGISNEAPIPSGGDGALAGEVFLK